MFKLFMMNFVQLSAYVAAAVAVIFITIELAQTYSEMFVALPALLIGVWFAYDKAKVDYEIEQMKE